MQIYEFSISVRLRADGWALIVPLYQVDLIRKGWGGMAHLDLDYGLPRYFILFNLYFFLRHFPLLYLFTLLLLFLCLSFGIHCLRLGHRCGDLEFQIFAAIQEHVEGRVDLVLNRVNQRLYVRVALDHALELFVLHRDVFLHSIYSFYDCLQVQLLRLILKVKGVGLRA